MLHCPYHGGGVHGTKRLAVELHPRVFFPLFLVFPPRKT